MTSGFACQPWSALGDQGKSEDPRSGVLVSTLRAAHWLRAHSVLLECVQGAGKDVEVQKVISQFCALTQFKVAQVDLRRDRWWRLLANATLPQVET